MFDSYLILRIPAILFGLTIHEFAHGWVAHRLGDRTAELSGRLSFNPLSHLDVFGTIMLLFGPFGWAKPVPVNPYNFRNPRKDMVKVAAAGPAINILTAALIGLAIRFIPMHAGFAYSKTLIDFLVITMTINLGLAFFNLLPVPPLDGSNIVLGFLPPSQAQRYQQIMSKVPIIFLVLIVAEWMFHIPVFSKIMDPLWIPFKNIFQLIVFQKILF